MCVEQDYEVADDRKPEVESDIMAHCRVVGLRKAVEDVRQESGAMPRPLSLTLMRTFERMRSRPTSNLPSLDVNLMRLVSRFQATCSQYSPDKSNSRAICSLYLSRLTAMRRT